MERRVVRGTLAGLLLAGCVRVNPNYGDGDAQSTTGSAGPGESATSNPSESTGSTGPTVGSDAETGPGSVDLGVPTTCGDGALDPGEECDDGNEAESDGCTSDCTVSVVEVWAYEEDVVPGLRNRFSALALQGDRVIAVGRGGQDPQAVERARVVVLGPQGDLIDDLLMGLDPNGQADGLGVEVDGSDVYVAGFGFDRVQSAMVARLAMQGDGTLIVDWAVAVPGRRAEALLVADDPLVVGVMEFGSTGSGLASMSPEGQLGPSWMDLDDSPSQVRALLDTGTRRFAAGKLFGDAFVAEIFDPTLQGFDPVLTVCGEGTADDSFQALLVEGDALIVAGSVHGSEGEAAWIGRYSLQDFTPRWFRAIDRGSLQDDEFEALALAGDGNVLAAGMLGDPPQAVLMKVSIEDGQTLWSLKFERSGFDAGYVRALEARGPDIYLAGERQVVDELDAPSVGFIMHLRE